jgi:thioredoxin-related protein
MKKLSILVSLLVISIFYSQTNWMTLDQAMAAQKTQPKKIIIVFYADWCAFCKNIDKETYNHPEISKILNENYYAVKFNAESTTELTIFGQTFINHNVVNGKEKNSLHDFTKYMNVTTLPATVFLDEHYDLMTILQGTLTPKELEAYLILMSTEKYKKIDSREKWENFHETFKSNIKN